MQVPQSSFQGAVFHSGLFKAVSADDLLVTIRDIEALEFHRDQGYCLKQSHICTELWQKALFEKKVKKGWGALFKVILKEKENAKEREAMAHGRRTTLLP